METNENFDLGIELCRYEVGCIINSNRYTIGVSNYLDDATTMYEQAVEAKRNDTDHVIIFLYDYDKAANINYYDSEID